MAGLASDVSAHELAGSTWERRFPTFTSRLPSRGITHGHPPSSAILPAALSQSPDVARRAARTPTPGAREGAAKAVSRLKATVKLQSQVLTPSQAIERAIADSSVVVDYRAASIVPGQSCAGQRAALVDTKGAAASSAGRCHSAELRLLPTQQLHRSTHDWTVLAPAVASPLPNPRREAFSSLLLCGEEGSTTGIGRMEAALERVHARLAHVPLEQRWVIIASWLNQYFDDCDAATLVRQMREVNQAVERETTGRRKPCAFQTAMSFMLLEQLLHVLTRSKPELHGVALAIRDTLLQAIYISPPKVDLNETFSVLRDPGNVEHQRTLIERYYTKTYFQKMRDLQRFHSDGQLQLEVAERQKTRITAILDRTVQFWQRYTMQLILNAWRGFRVGQRRERGQLEKIESQAAAVARLEREVSVRDQQLAEQAAQHERSTATLRSDVTALRRMLDEERAKAVAREEENCLLRSEIEVLREKAMSEGEWQEQSLRKLMSRVAEASDEADGVRDRGVFVEIEVAKDRINTLTATVESLRQQVSQCRAKSAALASEIEESHAAMRSWGSAILSQDDSWMLHGGWHRGVLRWMGDAAASVAEAPVAAAAREALAVLDGEGSASPGRAAAAVALWSVEAFLRSHGDAQARAASASVSVDPPPSPQTTALHSQGPLVQPPRLVSILGELLRPLAESQKKSAETVEGSLIDLANLHSSATWRVLLSCWLVMEHGISLKHYDADCGSGVGPELPHGSPIHSSGRAISIAEKRRVFLHIELVKLIVNDLVMKK